MKLSKGRLIKIINTKSQSNKNRKLGKRGKKSEHYRSYKNNKPFNLNNKTIRRMKGGEVGEVGEGIKDEDNFTKFKVTLDDVSFDGKTIPKIYDFEYIPQQIPVQNSQSKSSSSTVDMDINNDDNNNNNDNNNNSNQLNASITDVSMENTPQGSEEGVSSGDVFGVTYVNDHKLTSTNVDVEQLVNEQQLVNDDLQVIETKEQLIKENVGEMSSQEIIKIVEDWVDARIKKSCENNTNIQGGLQGEPAVSKLVKTFTNTANSANNSSQ